MFGLGNIRSHLLDEASASAAMATASQLRQWELQALQWKDAIPIDRPLRTDGFVSGYAFGMATAMLSRRGLGPRPSQTQLKRVANATQRFLKSAAYDLPVWESWNENTWAFQLGTIVGGQEQTNKDCNPNIWEPEGGIHNLLFETLKYLHGQPDQDFLVVNLLQLYYRNGLPVETASFIQPSLSEILN